MQKIPLTGNEEIDRQHAGLLDALERLEGWIGTSMEVSAVFTALEYLRDYAARHFEYEEEVLRKAGYPDLESHSSDHRIITERVAELTANIIDGEEVTREVLDTMRDLLVRHIGEDDQKFAEFVHSKSPVSAS